MITRREFARLSAGVALAAGTQSLRGLDFESGMITEGSSARRVGRRINGTYWTSGQEAVEAVDLLSGNLNFIVPLIRGGASGGPRVVVTLSHNSQLWVQSGGQLVAYGNDLGFGYGWQVQIGSIATSHGANGLSTYTFTNRVGTEYPFVQDDDHWISPLYAGLVWYPELSHLKFRDGSTWIFDCRSGSLEPDAGALHPTRVLDTNGNYIDIVYASGNGEDKANTSARIIEIRDARAQNVDTNGVSYSFKYDSRPIPHLLEISSHVHTTENYAFTYESLELSSPFVDGPALGPVTVPKAVRRLDEDSVGFSHSFGAELEKAQFGFGGSISWQYRTVRFPSGSTVREVRSRDVVSAHGTSQIDYFEKPVPTGSSHASTTLVENGGATSRTWTFCDEPSSFANGLWLSLDEPGRLTLNEWSQTPTGIAYLGRQKVIRDQGSSLQASYRVEYIKDSFGNVLSEAHFHDGEAADPTRTVSNEYLTDSRYVRAGIKDRLLSSLAAESSSTTQRRYAYDTTILLDRPGVDFHNYAASGPDYMIRGNVTESTIDGINRIFKRDVSGFLVEIRATNDPLHVQQSPMGSSSRIASIAVRGRAERTIQFAFDQDRLQASRADSESGTTVETYDSSGRVLVRTPATGNPVSYLYAPGGFTIVDSDASYSRTVDGFGRVLRTERREANGATRTTDFEYGPAPNSPLGRLLKKSVHSPGSDTKDRVFTWDALGRLTEIVEGNEIVAAVSYEGHHITVTQGGQVTISLIDPENRVQSIIESALVASEGGVL